MEALDVEIEIGMISEAAGEAKKATLQGMKILAGDFLVSTAGSTTGKMYGSGIYLAESITKADEYTAKMRRISVRQPKCRTDELIRQFFDELFFSF